ncbi:autotransporter domain-containing protein [Halomonas cerina]|uniref:Outer membrane lipase/esterase n=1 Tax=Halomonas cerina TaxID=447424 RepID=A0A839V4E2_9GAMM|nr:autotransporter domain-containing SGNH/GDSL hydrolase family protein [Halomonas cerina]MBB3188890.1 outer membrane lipase/esterase [Halomonas cerina]
MFLPIPRRDISSVARERAYRTRLFVLLLVLALWPGLAAAYSQLIVFGDSLSDSGQFPDVERIALGEIGSLRFTNRLGPSYRAPSPYGRVSAQRLAEALGLAPLLPSTSLVREQTGAPDGTNYATGGYTTPQILASIARPDGSVVDTGLVSRTRDGYLVEQGTADPEALYYVNGGGNDFFDGLVTGPATAAASAGTLADGVDRLVAAGARTLVVWNLPDVGATPAGLASGQRETFSSLVRVFNQTLGERLRRHDGRVDIIRLNVGALFEEVVAAPTDFGFAGGVALTDVCFSSPGCDVTPFGLSSSTPDPDRLLFNDGLHPTTAGQQILADYALALIEAPRTLALAIELAVGALNAQQQSITYQLRPGLQHDTWRVYVQGDHHDGQADGDRDARLGEATQGSVGVGLVVPVGQGWLGAAVTEQRAELDAPGAFELDGQAYSLFARQQFGRVGVQAMASRGEFDLDLQRRIALGVASRTLDGTTEGDGWAADLRLDYRLTASESPWYNAPFIGYRHIEADIEGYREQGSAANALRVADQSVTDRQAEVGFLVDRAPAGGLGFFAELAGGRYLDKTRDGAEVRLASLPTNRWSGEGREREDDSYLRLDAGLRVQLGGVTVQAGGGVQGWSETAAHVQLSAGFTF